MKVCMGTLNWRILYRKCSWDVNLKPMSLYSGASISEGFFKNRFGGAYF